MYMGQYYSIFDSGWEPLSWILDNHLLIPNPIIGTQPHDLLIV